MSSLMLATLCLNEMEWLPKLYEQHKDWPGLKKWVFVESADRCYAKANPTLVSKEGLSVDGTTEFLREIYKNDHRVEYVPLGFSSHPDKAQGKVESRNAYARIAEAINPDYLLVLDADEFYCRETQPAIVECMEKGFTDSGSRRYAYVFRQREIWRPPSIADRPLFDLEIKGSLWNITHARGWKWFSGLKYYEHNHLEPFPKYYNTGTSVERFLEPTHPQYIHLGFASSGPMRLAKNAYYVQRGEQNDGHGKHVICREAFRTWKAGEATPFNSYIVKYDGPIPEAFQ